MKKIKESKLFSLVKNLSMSEKRYFKLFSERHVLGEINKYALLFEIYESLDVENDASIKKLAKEKKIKVDFLSADKNYLFNLILQSLNQFHSSKSLNIIIKQQLISIEILFYKGLYGECLKLIDSTIKYCERCENFSMILEALYWKKNCLGYSFGIDIANEVNDLIDLNIKKINNLQEIVKLYYKSYKLITQNEENESEEIIQEFTKLLNNPLLKDETEALSLTSKVYFLLIKTHYFKIINDRIGEESTLLKLIAYIETNEYYMEEHPLDYISIYERYLSIVKHRDSAVFYEKINYLRSFVKVAKIRKEIIEYRIFILTYSKELEFLLFYNEFTKTIEVINKIEDISTKLEVKIEPFYLIQFYTLFATSYLCFGSHAKAITNINLILNNYDFNDRPYFYIKAEILKILVHFELKNYSFVGSVISSVLKKYAKETQMSEFEVLLLKTLNKTIKNFEQTRELNRNLLINLYESNINLENKNKYDFYQLLYLKWIDSFLKKAKINELYFPTLAK